jgi:hypothetical protein
MSIAKSKKANTARPRVVLITQGGKPVIVAQYQEGVIESITEVEVPSIPKEKMIDTNGGPSNFSQKHENRGSFSSIFLFSIVVYLGVAEILALAGES